MNVPGPGNYETTKADLRAAPKFGFGSDTRDGGSQTARHSALFPGPGAYKPKPFFGNEAKSSSIHGKLKTLDSNMNTPGPGTYESTLRHKKTAPSFGTSLSKRGEEMKPFKVPAANPKTPQI